MFDHLDWDGIHMNYELSHRSHVVVDDFLPPETTRQLHSELLANQMWRIKNPASKHLHNNRPSTNLLTCIAPTLENIIAQTFDGKYRLIDYWAMLYSRNTDGNVHADFGDLTLTHWLTPDKYNACPRSGGLVLYDVRRPRDMPLTQYLSSGDASRAYVDSHTAGRVVVIPYRFNRAVVFNPTTFHKSHRPQFDLSRTSHMRMNVTFSFSNPAEMRRQLETIS